jgi:hypothetical protein
MSGAPRYSTTARRSSALGRTASGRKPGSPSQSMWTLKVRAAPFRVRDEEPDVRQAAHPAHLDMRVRPVTIFLDAHLRPTQERHDGDERGDDDARRRRHRLRCIDPCSVGVHARAVAYGHSSNQCEGRPRQHPSAAGALAEEESRGGLRRTLTLRRFASVCADRRSHDEDLGSHPRRPQRGAEGARSR